MTSTFTTSKTFTITHARYITSKVAADLRQLQIFYGSPDNDRIAAFAEEAAILLRDGYLDRVDYGFKRNVSFLGEKWVLLLRYTARNGVLADDHAGRVPPGVDVSRARFSSFLSYSTKFVLLPRAEQARIEADLPISRSPANESGFVSGTWGGERTYSSSGEGLGRSVFRPI
ncbi:MAG TPA: hypothetical protein VGS21_11070 [Acidimicrobiales bacterium]|nr:hypothetical protein [Acidimicrobiales bacterium]